MDIVLQKTDVKCAYLRFLMYKDYLCTKSITYPFLFRFNVQFDATPSHEFQTFNIPIAHFIFFIWKRMVGLSK